MSGLRTNTSTFPIPSADSAEASSPNSSIAPLSEGNHNAQSTVTPSYGPQARGNHLATGAQTHGEPNNNNQIQELTLMAHQRLLMMGGVMLSINAAPYLNRELLSAPEFYRAIQELLFIISRLRDLESGYQSQSQAPGPSEAQPKDTNSTAAPNYDERSRVNVVDNQDTIMPDAEDNGSGPPRQNNAVATIPAPSSSKRDFIEPISLVNDELQYQEGFFSDTMPRRGSKPTFPSGGGLFDPMRASKERRLRASSNHRCRGTGSSNNTTASHHQRHNSSSSTSIANSHDPEEEVRRLLVNLPSKLQTTTRTLANKGAQDGVCPLNDICPLARRDFPSFVLHLMSSTHLDIYGKSFPTIHNRTGQKTILTRNHGIEGIDSVFEHMVKQTMSRKVEENGKVKYECIMGCPCILKDKYNVIRHVKAEHFGIYELQCNVCNAWFTREDNLRQHSATCQPRVHT